MFPLLSFDCLVLLVWYETERWCSNHFHFTSHHNSWFKFPTQQTINSGKLTQPTTQRIQPKLSCHDLLREIHTTKMFHNSLVVTSSRSYHFLSSNIASATQHDEINKCFALTNKSAKKAQTRKFLFLLSSFFHARVGREVCWRLSH